jgi:hypothetical protein
MRKFAFVTCESRRIDYEDILHQRVETPVKPLPLSQFRGMRSIITRLIARTSSVQIFDAKRWTCRGVHFARESTTR